MMELGHIHLGFKELSQAIIWMEKMIDCKPSYQNPGMAVFSWDTINLVFDQSESDSEATIAFRSSDCDLDFKRIKGHGAEVLDPPEDQPWGVRVAYFKGPGKVTFEIEQLLGQ